MSTPEQDLTQEELGIPSFLDLLSEREDSPGSDQIELWKQEYGEIFCSAFSETELFIWRPLARKEWRLRQLSLAREEGADPFLLEEEVVRACMLWMSSEGEKSLEAKAGSLSTLHEQLLQNSNFIDPRLASNLVIKL